MYYYSTPSGLEPLSCLRTMDVTMAIGIKNLRFFLLWTKNMCRHHGLGA
jgi:hypothetical protein